MEFRFFDVFVAGLGTNITDMEDIASLLELMR